MSYWLYNRLLIPLLMRNNCTCITTGALRKSKKSCNNESRIPWREYEKNTVWDSWCILDSMKIILDRGNHSSGSKERHLIRKLFSFLFFFFLSSFGVCFGIKVKRKRWTMLMLNLSDTGSISSIKQNLEDFMFFFPLFVIESSVFEVKSLHWKIFLCCSVLEFNFFSSLWLSFCLSTWTL